MFPRQRQKRDIDTKADYGEIAVHQPPNHLEGLRGPRPSVPSGRLGGDKLIFAAAKHGSCLSEPLTEAVHLWCERRIRTGWSTRKSRVPAECGHICWGNELGK